MDSKIHQKLIVSTILQQLTDQVSKLKIKKNEKSARKRRHSKTDKMDILSELDKRGLLKNVSQAIFKKLDLKSLSSCGAVSTSWRRMVEELSRDKRADLKWINCLWPKSRFRSGKFNFLNFESKMTESRMHINPRSETGTDDFDIWGLSKVHIDDNENIYVSGGVQVGDSNR